jgi:hypothetical protein
MEHDVSSTSIYFPLLCICDINYNDINNLNKLNKLELDVKQNFGINNYDIKHLHITIVYT